MFNTRILGLKMYYSPDPLKLPVMNGSSVFLCMLNNRNLQTRINTYPYIKTCTDGVLCTCALWMKSFWIS